ncbi:hypothetical protein VTN77DRAFT_1603 [Rasamsonia byssochlamydoides]|uniref:uncharacterized protein n=1 Tax=Rasamsonia byssochlamydoides TaxID=89139 RepID=UPI00374256AA
MTAALFDAYRRITNDLYPRWGRTQLNQLLKNAKNFYIHIVIIPRKDVASPPEQKVISPPRAVDFTRSKKKKASRQKLLFLDLCGLTWLTLCIHSTSAR